jgi:hypothetical protein
MAITLNGQTDSSQLYREMDSLNNILYNELVGDTLIVKDTLTPEKFIPIDKQIYRTSKANLRKSLASSNNPPFRKNLNNWIVFVWGLLIVILVIFFKTNFPLQYRLLSKAWYSHISFNEFFDTQTSVFKNSKLFTWLIISLTISMGVYIVIKANNIDLKVGEASLIGLICVSVMLLFTANQWLKNVFAFSFYQPGLSHDYAIIFRIQAYIASLFLLPVLMMIYYNGSWNLDIVITVVLIVYILLVYAASLIKFIFSGRFLQNQSNFILILYLCAFEILPLLVLVKSITNLLEYD